MGQQGGPPPGPQAPGGADPKAEIQQALDLAQQQLQSFASKPTYEDVMAFLRDNRARSFVLDIETDSTIQLDEQKEKQSRAEFMQVLGNILPQLGAMVAAQPAMSTFAGEILKFSVAPYRVGRQLDNAIDDAVQVMRWQPGERVVAKGSKRLAPRRGRAREAQASRERKERQIKQWSCRSRRRPRR